MGPEFRRHATQGTRLRQCLLIIHSHGAVEQAATAEHDTVDGVIDSDQTGSTPPASSTLPAHFASGLMEIKAGLAASHRTYQRSLMMVGAARLPMTFHRRRFVVALWALLVGASGGRKSERPEIKRFSVLLYFF